jgi:FkbH-like protein
VDVAHDVAHLVVSMRAPSKKVLVLDLDNTLWGGVIGDDGLEGIDLGGTSPRGEAYQAFQRYVKSLKERGILLAIASKNDPAQAMIPFRSHPEMVLGLDDFVAFEASWDSKADALQRIATKLSLGLDSLVFADDNPAEIALVSQTLADVACVSLGPDPADFTGRLQDARLFEPRSLTREDAGRTLQYRSEEERQRLSAQATDMASYWRSLGMVATLSAFRPVDVPRIAQLVNKTNQFNLTTKRRTEAELTELMRDEQFLCFTVRLTDRFGDQGLISVLISRVAPPRLEIDTWLMSCRVLQRQVEFEAMNELARLAARAECTSIRGSYLATPRNGLVRDLYPRMGFSLVQEGDSMLFERSLAEFVPFETSITVERRGDDED